MTGTHAQVRLSSVISQSLRTALRTHRNYVETLAEQSVRDGSAVGFVAISGEGESVAEIQFPIKFLEKPVFTVGFELADNVPLEWGSFPQCSATVATWMIEPPDISPLYVGAIVGIVTSGVSRSVLHYRFEARSFTNPVGAELSVGALL